MLKTLKRWRKHLNLSPLLPKSKGTGVIKSTNYIRRIVQYCFDQAIEKLNEDNLSEKLALLFRSRNSISTYLVEVFYNRKRRHSTLGHVSPMMFEAKWNQQQNISLSSVH